MRKTIGGTMIGLAFLIGLTGVIIMSCDTPAFADQIRNAAIGIVTMAFAFLVGWVGDKVAVE